MTWIEVYGPWIGLGLIVLFNWVLPAVRDKLLPASLKRMEDERKAAEEARKTQYEQIEDERKWLRQMFSQHLEALKAIEKNLVQINADNSVIRDTESTIIDNQTTIMGKQDTHHNEMMHAVSQMRERTARIDGIAEGKKLPRTGPIAPEKPLTPASDDKPA